MSGQWDQSAAEYESACASRVGARHAVAFAFGRHALASALQNLGAEPGDEVVISALTCKVVPLAIRWAGLTPVYADISEVTLNLDSDRLAQRIGTRTRAVLFQHTYGSGAGVDEVAGVANDQGVALIEDCAQSLPMRSGDHLPGRLGRAAIFSCNLQKPLPAASGGFLATNDDELAVRVRANRDRLPERSSVSSISRRLESWLFRRLVGPRTYWMALSAYRQLSPSQRDRPVEVEVVDQVEHLAYRPDASQLREGINWLRRLDEVADHRRQCCNDYWRALSRHGASGDWAPRLEGYPLFYVPVLAGDKRSLLAAASRRHLQVVAWPGVTPIYPVENTQALPAYGYTPGSCPVAESVARRLVGLPTELDITAAHRRRIVDLVTSSAR
jgi:perosamine synthetase